MATENNLTPMMRQYREIKAQHPDCLLFYRLGDFFELFFEDAVTASRELDIMLTHRGKTAGQDIPMCGVPFHAYEAYLGKLLKKGYRVVICDQVETPEEAKRRGAKGPLERRITRIVTNGTLTEDALLTDGDNFIFALSLPEKNKKKVAIAIADISTGFFGLEEIAMTDLANALERWHPTEIILSDEAFAYAPWADVFDIWKRVLTILPKARFSEASARHLLESTYNVQTLDVFGEMTPLEIQAAGVLVDYVMTTQCCRTLSLRPPRLLASQNVLAIDASTRRNLELTVSSSTQRNGSLLATINRTVTPLGRRLLAKWMAAPLLDLPLIEQRLDDAEILLKAPTLRKELRDNLKGLPDLERVLSRMVLGRSGPRDLGALQQTLAQAETLQTLLQQAFSHVSVPTKKGPIPAEILGKTPECAAVKTFSLSQPFMSEALHRLKEKLTQALRLGQLPALTREGDFIADGYNADLDEIRQLRGHISEKLAALQEDYRARTQIATLKIRRNNIWGIYVEVSSANASNVPYDFVHRQTLTNCVRYTTEELVDLERRVNQSEGEALAQEEALFRELLEEALAERAAFGKLAEVLATLDVTASNAELFAQNGWVRPRLTKDPVLSIIEGRHPVVEAAFRDQDKTFAANSCTLDGDARQFLLITGPNMAGKSTYLRQNALIIVLAQMGCFVPAKSATIGLVDKIFSRIGASDDLASGRSTFMMEMVETSAILHQATSQSFVILDEIGRGTATYDGLAIAGAVSEYISQKIRCRTLFATHYHELTQMGAKLKGVVSMTASVKEWDGKIVFLYKMIDGCAQRSYGIHVAQLAGLPTCVIQRASEILDSLEDGKETELASKPRRSERGVRSSASGLDAKKAKLF